jgi:16S rRNA (adenine1518-N6/adenine1519-N6)-dimethyltransferase
VFAVEKDYALAEKLDKELGGNPNCKIQQGDILRTNLNELISRAKELHGCAADDTRRVRIVANLPYYITTELLKQLLPLGDKIESLLLLLQDEVAQRLTTEHPGSFLLATLSTRITIVLFEAMCLLVK